MVYIEPSFEIDKKGRVICRKHSNHDYFVRPGKDFFQDLYLDVELTCKTCFHYQNDDCYFPKTRIDEIEQKRQNKEEKAFLCRLCKKKIERMFTIIYKLYYKEMYDVEMPLICCECYERLNNNEFLSYSKKKFDFYLLNIVISIFLLFYFIVFVSILNIQPIFYILIVIPLFFIISFIAIYIIIKCVKKLKYTTFGIKYYKKYFSNQEKKEN